MGIPIFVQLCGWKLLIGNWESHSLPDNGQQGLGGFFIGIPVDPQKVRHRRKCPIDRGGSQKLLLPLYHQFHDWILEYDLEKIDQMFAPAKE